MFSLKKLAHEGLKHIIIGLLHDDFITWTQFPFPSRSLGESSHKGGVMQSFDVCFVVSLNKLLKKQSSCLWFEAI